MSEELLSVEQVAERLGLHVRTVRSYIHSGRLRAVRIGKQYRVSRTDLDALTGQAPPVGAGPVARAEVSSIVQLDGVDRVGADRLGTLVLAAANTTRGDTRPLHVQTVHDEEHHRMKIVILGGAAATADLLHLVNAVLTAGGGSPSPAAADG